MRDTEESRPRDVQKLLSSRCALAIHGYPPGEVRIIPAVARAIDRAPATDDVLREVLLGLSARTKRLPCKLFYDEVGSRLFERICELDQYYLTRTELGILREHAGEVAEVAGVRLRVVEYGSGASVKDAPLARRAQASASYARRNRHRAHRSVRAPAALALDYPELDVQPVCADY